MEITLIVTTGLALLGWTWALLLRRSARKLSDGIVEWKKRADEAAELATQQKTLADHRLGFMSDYEKERDSVWRIYRQMALSAGAAQQWLLREYSNAVRALNAQRIKNGEKPFVPDPRLQAVVGEFQDTHPAADSAAVEAALAQRPELQPKPLDR